ncbi:BtpA/SgcQ family protein [Olsenella sp. An188]|uniref:BtpA/SgcQ family protein n=1 Tax=Olsenella sp. An188 TaxID=1965579 RepID=UPI000B3B05A6|nr:BtpA/SgcQ family protein [Olsenella sp. An188]HJB54414.1 BtpA/SgcQ family protein [Candidatus Olsenella avistercoris]
MVGRDRFPVALAMIQPEPMPGSYRNDGMGIDEVVERALAEAQMLADNGFDGYIIQNRNDAPVLQRANVETIAYMTRVALELRRAFPQLIQGILVNWDGEASLAVADAAGSDFIRVEHTYTSVEVGYAGLMHAQCVDVLALKKRLGSKVPVFADVQEVHYEQLCGKSVVDNAWDTVMNAFADGLFVGGHSLAESMELVRAVRARLGDEVPIFLSSGSTGENVKEILSEYDGVSVGTWVKDGNMRNPINPERARVFMDQVRELRAERSARGR